MKTVTVFGLTIESEIPLPEAPPTAGFPQVIVRLAPVEKPPYSPESDRAYAITRQEFRVYWRGVGTFLIRNGAEIFIDPEPGGEAAVIRLYLLGPALGILLHQRGFLVLHASVVSIDGAVVGFMGEKGWGKSTTAAALNARGHALVSDDVLAVLPYAAGGPIVQPGLPQFKLWPEAATASFGDDPAKLVRLHSNVEKRSREANHGVRGELIPLRRLYLLGRGTKLESVPMNASAALMSLVRHSYLSHLMHLLGQNRENFEQCAHVVQSIPVHHLRRPKDLSALGDIASLVEAEVAAEAEFLAKRMAV